MKQSKEVLTIKVWLVVEVESFYWEKVHRDFWSDGKSQETVFSELKVFTKFLKPNVMYLTFLSLITFNFLFTLFTNFTIFTMFTNIYCMIGPG